MAVQLQQFREARTLVNQWIRVIQGQKGRYIIDNDLFESYRTLKTELTQEERINYLALEPFPPEACFRI